MDPPILELAAVSKAFHGIRAVGDVSLDLGRGRMLGLIGQNGAGKSTLMNMIGGILQPDSGTMRLDGRAYAPRSPGEATASGVAMIHQELNLFTNLTVAENIFVDRFPRRRIGPASVIDRKAMLARTRDLLAEVSLDLPPETPVERLSPGERQLIEIAKALEGDARIIIFDEPTTSLTARETERLFELIRRLRHAGKSMLYISHILGDVLRLADDIAILRDGELVASGERQAFDVDRMITLMVGRSLEQLYPKRGSEPKAGVCLAVNGLTAKGAIRDVSFSLRHGEVLGIFGLMGSGRTELARIVFGLDEFDGGEIKVGDTTLGRHSPRGSMRHGLAFITEDRRAEGLLMSKPISDNIVLAALPRYAVTPLGVIELALLAAAGRSAADRLQIKIASMDQTAGTLSGGNQQKVVLAKWLMSEPSIFIMDEPTRGIDVGAKHEIYAIIDRLARDDGGVLFISSEIEELLAMCDRILVMSRGEIVGAFDRPDFDQQSILRAAFREEEPA